MIPLTITGESNAAAILQEPRDRAGAVGARKLKESSSRTLAPWGAMKYLSFTKAMHAAVHGVHDVYHHHHHRYHRRRPQ